MTSKADWHGLTFDPARGNPEVVGVLAKQMTDTGNWLKESFTVLENVKKDKDSWTGEASKEFAEKLGDLPGLLDDAHQSLLAAGKALSGWQATLAGHQAQAIDLENQARQALADAQRADAAAKQAQTKANTPVMYDTNDTAAAEAAQNKAKEASAAAEQAGTAAEAAWDRLEDIRRQARDLQDRWEDDADAVADQLDDATDIAPGMWDAIGDAFESMGDWVVHNLGKIGDIAGMIAAVAGALSFIPFLAPVTGPIALIAGGVALAAHGGEMVVEGKWADPTAWVGLATDALGVIPGVGVAAKSLGEAASSLRTVEGLGEAVIAGGKMFLSEAGRVAEAATMFEKLGSRTAQLVGGNADTIAKVAQNTVNLTAQVPVALDLAVGNDTTKSIKDGVGYGAGAVAAGQSVGDWGKTASGVGGLGRSLGQFARAFG
ncbi:hypothetical protein [Amycolatopsis sp. CA-230715]|uniref:hypothetical protein n=1 Tax=Amycolatopsis sp. CA-230715 TaxID=2745196 RepID=UPI001C01C0B5|nr:hypothetical protein [Amycolatopsis sp. CA-230715]QWF84220.1 hypothetical protein HUW46_07669 [Amycolatopsis sp. CA-230715]